MRRRKKRKREKWKKRTDFIIVDGGRKDKAEGKGKWKCKCLQDDERLGTRLGSWSRSMLMGERKVPEAVFYCRGSVSSIRAGVVGVSMTQWPG